MKLVSENVGGNIHDAVDYVNRGGLAKFVIHLESVSGRNSIVVLRVPDDFDMERWWAERARREPNRCTLARADVQDLLDRAEHKPGCAHLDAGADCTCGLAALDERVRGALRGV